MDSFFLVLLGVAVICTSIPVDSFKQEKNCIGIDVHTEDYGDDVEWSFGACSSLDEYKDHATFTEACCQPPGNYELVCKSRHGLGWRGGYVEIHGIPYCEKSMADVGDKAGTEKRETATMPGGGPWAGPCVSTHHNAKDKVKDTCDDYIGHEDRCGLEDDVDFEANLLCCACTDQEAKAAERVCKTCKTLANNGFYDFACGNPLLCPESCGVCSCKNTDKGEEDAGGDVCDDYFGNEEAWCGKFDDSDFSSTKMCCACGGGTRSA